MTGYFLLVVIEAVIYGLFYLSKWTKGIKNRHLWYLILSFFVLFFFSAFRAPHLGIDYSNYILALQAIDETGTYYMEPGFILLNKFILLFTSHHFGISITVNLFLMVPLFFFITKSVHRKYWPLCVMIFVLNPYMFLQSTFNIMRQCCATGLILSAVLFFRNKQLWMKLLAVALIIIAAQFHKMAYCMLVLVPVMLFGWKKKYWVVLATVAFLINMSSIDLLSLFFRIVDPWYAEYESSLLNIGIYVIFIYFFILGICHYYDDLCTDKRSKTFVDLYLFSLCFLLIALPNDMTYRIYIMLAFTAIPAVPVLWRKLGSLRVTELPVIGTLKIWEKFPILTRIPVIKAGYVTYYFGLFVCYIFYLWLTNNQYYIPYSFGF